MRRPDGCATEIDGRMRSQGGPFRAADRMQLEDLNALDTPTAERELRRCCGSAQWLREMVAARPFETAEA